MRVVGNQGENLGVMPTKEAVKKAQELNLDLIEISPQAKPPVAKIADYGKFQYEQAKKAKEAKAKAHTTETKSIQIEVVTGENDLTRKARQAASWLKEGHRVKIELFLKGRYKYMEPEFLKERLKRFTLLVPEDYKIADEIKKGPKGFTIILERASGKAKAKEERKAAEDTDKKDENKQVIHKEGSSDQEG